jgi:hypothetical protein
LEYKPNAEKGLKNGEFRDLKSESQYYSSTKPEKDRYPTPAAWAAGIRLIFEQ